MLKSKMNGRVLFILLVGLLCLGFLLVGCGNGATDAGPSVEPSAEPSAEANEDPQEQGQVYDFYNKVELGQTKEEVDAVLGVDAEELTPDIHSYENEDGYGVTIGLSTMLSPTDANAVFTKMVSGSKWTEYQLQADFRKENAISDDQAANIIEGMTYDEVKGLLGSEGIEISLSQQYDGSIKVERSWYKDSIVSLFSISFNGTDGNGIVTTVNNL